MQGFNQNGKQSGSGPDHWPDANAALPMYRANLNHPVTTAEHGNAVASARRKPGRPYRKAGRVGHSIGMTEKAKASGNALDMPTSVWSEMARKQVEPCLNSEKQMTAGARLLMRLRTNRLQGRSYKGHLPVRLSCSVLLGSGSDHTWLGLMTA